MSENDKLWLESVQSVDVNSKNVVVLRTTKAFKNTCWKALLTNWRNHPRFDSFMYWVNRSSSNHDWFHENIDKIRLVDDWIEILGDVFCLEDEESIGNWVDVFDYCWSFHFTYQAAQRHVKATGRQMPSNWFKYLDFLPWSDKNKVSFLTDVLGMRRAGYRILANRSYSCYGEHSFYWSNDEGWVLACSNRYIATDLIPARINYKPIALSLRCLKNS